MDVLEHLPVPVLRDSFWPLLQRKSQSEFRSASRGALRLAELLTSELRLGHYGWDLSAEDVGLLTACLGRHEHIKVLRIETDSEEHTVELLRQGEARCRRVGYVILGHCWELTHATGAAIAQACPALRSLRICETGHHLEASFFAPLQALEQLAEVNIEHTHVAAPVMAALAALPDLRTLRLANGPGDSDLDINPPAHTFHPAIISDAASIAQLRSLSLSAAFFDRPDVYRQLGLLGCLTQLTSLSVSTPHERLIPWQKGLARDAAAAAAMNAVLAQLGSLQLLKSLSIANVGSFVDDAGFEGLRQMRNLTHLRVDGISLRRPTDPGSLPRLQDLRLAHPSSGTELLSALQALLPLTQLGALHAELSLTPYAQAANAGAERDSDPSPLVTDLRALRAAAQLLAVAPCLQQISLTLNHPHQPSGAHTQVTATLAALTPLQLLLGSLTLRSCTNLHIWGLGAAMAPFQRLRALTLQRCEVGLPLLDVATQATALRKLCLECCQGATAELAREFLEVRRAPLHVQWYLKGEAWVTVQGALAVLETAHITLSQDDGIDLPR